MLGDFWWSRKATYAAEKQVKLKQGNQVDTGGGGWEQTLTCETLFITVTVESQWNLLLTTHLF
jgi:hypothetical protein